MTDWLVKMKEGKNIDRQCDDLRELAEAFDLTGNISVGSYLWNMAHSIRESNIKILAGMSPDKIAEAYYGVTEVLDSIAGQSKFMDEFATILESIKALLSAAEREETVTYRVTWKMHWYSIDSAREGKKVLSKRTFLTLGGAISFRDKLVRISSISDGSMANQDLDFWSIITEGDSGFPTDILPIEKIISEKLDV